MENLPSCAAKGHVEDPVFFPHVARIAVSGASEQDAVELQALRPVDCRYDNPRRRDRIEFFWQVFLTYPVRYPP